MMPNTSKIIPDESYGIYINNQLAATTTCPKLYLSITKALQKIEKQHYESKKQNKIA